MANEFVVKNGLITPTVQLPGATSGTVTISAPAVAGTTSIALPATAGTIVTTGDTGTVTNTMLAGSIANNKLANSTISGTALGGTLPTATFNVSGTGLSGSATYNGTTSSTFTVTSNATSANTVSTIVARDASGDFSAGTITAALNGNASTASTLQIARTITLSGDVAGSVSFNGSTNVTITTTIQPDSVALGTDTTGNYVATVAVSGTGLSVSGSGVESAAVTVTSNATNANTASTIVARDASGNFSAGTITAALSGNASTASALQTARTISLTGDVTGSVSFDGSGNAAIATTIQPDSVALGTDTTGNYMVNVAAGTGVSVSHTQGEGSTATVSIGQAVGTTDNVTFNNVTVNGTLNSDDITSTNISVSGNATITGNLTVSGTTTTVNSTAISIADINIELARNATTAAQANGAGLTVIGPTTSATLTYSSGDDRWNFNKNLNVGTVYGALSGNATTATTLQTARTINGVSFDGSANISFNTSSVSEGTNLYYTDARARGALSFTAGSGAYNSSTGVITIPTNTNQLTNGAGFITGYTETDTLATVTGRGATTSGAITISSGTTDQGLTMTVSDSSWNYIGFNHGATRKAYFGINGSGNPEWGTDSGAFTITGNYTTIGTSTRSPIFYDSDDTTYYVDPNSTSIMKGIDVRVGSVIQLYTSANSLRGYINATDTDDNHLQIATSGGEDIVFKDGGLSGTRNLVIRGGNTGTEAYGSMRSPIFYDSNDTSYYIDPASTSVLNEIGSMNIRSYSTISIRPSASNWAGFSFSKSTSNINANDAGYLLIRGTSDNWPVYTNEGITLVSDANSLNLFARGTYLVSGGNAWVRMGTGSTETFRLQSDYSYSLYSSRAPIFYDSDDTTYYLNPSSGSNLNGTFINNAGDTMSGGWNRNLLLKSTFPVIVFNSNNTKTGGIGYDYSVGDSFVFWVNGSNNDISGTGTVALRMNTGPYVTAPGSMRSPIFYDSDNTGYYLDPNSTSRLNRIDPDEIYNYGWFRNHNSGQGLYNQSTGQHWYSDENRYWNMGGGGLNGQGIRFRDNHNGTTRGYVYYDQSNNIGFLNQDGSWRLRVVSGDYSLADGSSMRAQIFYDSNDTNYYTDANSISRFYGLAIRGDSSSTDTSNQIFFWGSGNSTTSSIGFKANGGYFTNPTGNGDGYNTYLTMDSDGRGWVFRRGVGGSDFGAAYNSGWILNNGVWQANASMRAPIFYDSGNTGYYVDPADGGFNLRGGSSNRVTYYTNDSGIIVTNAEGQGLQMRIGAAWSRGGIYSNSYLDLGAESNINFRIANSEKGTMDSSSNLFAYGSMRAPIFYDYNDTGYYVDPHSVSIFNDIRASSGNTQIVTGNTGQNTKWRTLSSGATDIGISFYDVNDAWRMQLYASSGNYGFLNGNWASWDIRKVPSGELYLNNQSTYYINGSEIFYNRVYGNTDIRSRIYYDYDDTGYYIDPASYSNIWRLNAQGNFSSDTTGSAIYIGGQNVSTSNSLWINFHSDGDAAYRIGKPAGAWTQPLEIRFYTGIYHRAHQLYGGHRFYNYSSGNLLFSVANGDDNVRSIGDFYAPIMYDYNDTTYYVDPNNNSRLYALNLSNGQPNNSNYGRLRISSYTNGSSVIDNTTYNIMLGPYSTRTGAGYYYAGIAWNGLMNYGGGTAYDIAPHIWIGGYYRDTPGSERSDFVIAIKSGTGTTGTGSDLPQVRMRVDYNGIVTAYGDSRAPIFYDLDNTSYYLDPNSTTSIRTVGDWRSDSSSWTGEFSGKIQYHSNHWYFQSADQWIFRNSGGGNVIYGNQSGEFTATGNLRSPVYYDSNDTNYYADPNSNSVFYRLSTYLAPKYSTTDWADGFRNTPTSSWNFHGDVSAGGPSGTWWFYTSMRHSNGANYWGTQIAYGWEDNANEMYQRNITGNSFSGWVRYLNTNNFGTYHTFDGLTSKTGGTGTYQTSGDFRAPIFYDSASTSYYLDMSVNGGTLMATAASSDTLGYNASYGIYIGGINGRYIYSGNSSYTGPVFWNGSAAYTVWHSGNLTNLNQLTNGPGYIVGLTFDGLTAKTAGTGTYTTTGDFRAPIFYNHTDTGYYVDPDSLSVMNRISLGYNSGENNSIGCSNWFRSSGSTGWYNGSYAGGIYMQDSTWVRVYNNKQFYSENYIQSDSSVRAPIFYDSNNTSFYVDPSSTTTSAMLRGKIEFFDYDGAITTGARMYYGDRGTQSTASTNATVINYGVDGFGLCLESGSSGDSGLIKITDDGILIAGAADENLLIVWDEDAQSTRLTIDDSGNLVCSGNVTAYSDIKLKTNIEQITNAIDKVKQIRGVTFERIDEKDKYKGHRYAGVIAQEVEAVFPEVIDENSDGIKNVAYGNMVGLLIEAIKEQQSEIDELKALVRQLLAK